MARQPPDDDEVWVCRDGRRIPVSEMTPGHAKNALRMILRTMRRRQQLQRDLIALRESLRDLDEDDAKWGKS